MKPSFCLSLAGLLLSLMLVSLPHVAVADTSAKPGNGYVGVEVCATCHDMKAAARTRSHHDLAMQEASEQTVLGDFNDCRLEHYGITTRVHRKGDCFMVNT